MYDSIAQTVGDFMSNLYWLSEDQTGRLRPYFLMGRGRARVDDRCVLSRIIFINRNGLRWCDAPKECGPHKTLYNRWKRWSDLGVFARIMEELAAKAPVSNLPAAEWLLGDRGYDADWFREALVNIGIKPYIPGRKSRS